jgi:hypothetical protein
MGEHQRASTQKMQLYGLFLKVHIIFLSLCHPAC